MSEGWYKIDFTAGLRKASDARILRADVYKVSSKDETNNCAATTDSCEVALQIRFQSKVSLTGRHLINNLLASSFQLTDPTDDSKTTDVTLHNEGAFHLCSGDKIIVILSKSGSPTASLGEIFGVTDSRTILVITKIWFP